MKLASKSNAGYIARWFSTLSALVLLTSTPVGLFADEPWQETSREEIDIDAWRNPAQTAGEFLERLEHPIVADLLSGGAMLYEEELESAVEILRARYPLVSMRDRAERVTKFEDPISKNLSRDSQKSASKTQERLNNLGLLNTHRPAIGWGNARTESLRQLHSDSVGEFIRKPGAGLGRFPVASPYKLPLIESQFAGFDHAPVKSSIAKEPLGIKVTYASQPGTKSRFEHSRNIAKGESTSLDTSAWALHESVNRGFANANSTGFFKNIDEVAGFEPHQVRLRAKWSPVLAEGSLESGKDKPAFRVNPNQKITWRTNKVQLVSLLMHRRPKVYVTDEIPNMENLRSEDAPVRDLDKFEVEALDKLFAGEEIVLHASDNRIRMLGSIKCDTSCIDCHSASKKGDVLGAFSYEILRSPTKGPAPDQKTW